MMLQFPGSLNFNFFVVWLDPGPKKKKKFKTETNNSNQLTTPPKSMGVGVSRVGEG